MDNLKEIGLLELKKDELQTIDGGLVLASFKEVFDAFNWAYQEFKKGVDDGYNNR